MKRLPQLQADALPGIIEGILFVADEPVDTVFLVRALRRSRSEVEAALRELESQYEGRGLRLQRSKPSTGSGQSLVQLVSAPEAGPYIERFLGSASKQRLSTAALECLAIVAYRQPVTRAGVEAVRGVNSDGAIASLIARRLVEEVGRAPGPGRPVLLGTTMKFLEHFGLKNPKDLPPLPANLMPTAGGGGGEMTAGASE